MRYLDWADSAGHNSSISFAIGRAFKTDEIEAVRAVLDKRGYRLLVNACDGLLYGMTAVRREVSHG